MDKQSKTDVMSVAVDEPTDNSDVAQVCLYVRFSHDDDFQEALLGLIPQERHLTGEVIFNKIVSFFEENKLDLECVNILVRAWDGGAGHRACPLGCRSPQLRSLHCLSHQSLEQVEYYCFYWDVRCTFSVEIICLDEILCTDTLL